MTLSPVLSPIASTASELLAKTACFMEQMSRAGNGYVAEALRPQFVTAEPGVLVVQRHPAEYWPRLNLFVHARFTDALEWMDPADLPRFTVWTANDKNRKLHFGWCTQHVPQAMTEATFDFEEGIAGAVFTEGMLRNVVNPSRLPIFKPFTGIPYDYTSMLALPLPWGQRIVGVLCVDRMREELFDATTVKVMKSVASSIGMALGVEEWIRWDHPPAQSSGAPSS